MGNFKLAHYPTLADKLRARDVLYGTFVELPCAAVVEIAALAGWDFCIVDSEHGPVSTSSYPAMVGAGDCRGLPVMVRVAENRPALIQHTLDAGAAGVLVPQVSSYDAARSAVSASRFHPLGLRGLNGFVRAADYSSKPGKDYIAEANRGTVCALQLESADACQDAEKIAAIPGLDVLFVGPYDLSQSLGMPGETSHPQVLEAIKRVIEACKRHRIASGIYANSVEDALDCASKGVQLITCQADTLVLFRGLRELRTSIGG